MACAPNRTGKIQLHRWAFMVMLFQLLGEGFTPFILGKHMKLNRIAPIVEFQLHPLLDSTLAIVSKQATLSDFRNCRHIGTDPFIF